MQPWSWTTPVGLAGLLTMIALVRGVMRGPDLVDVDVEVGIGVDAHRLAADQRDEIADT